MLEVEAWFEMVTWHVLLKDLRGACPKQPFCQSLYH